MTQTVADRTHGEGWYKEREAEHAALRAEFIAKSEDTPETATRWKIAHGIYDYALATTKRTEALLGNTKVSFPGALAIGSGQFTTAELPIIENFLDHKINQAFREFALGDDDALRHFAGLLMNFGAWLEQERLYKLAKERYGVTLEGGDPCTGSEIPAKPTADAASESSNASAGIGC